VRKAGNLPPSCAVVTKSGKLNFLEPSGHLVPVMGLIYLYLFIIRMRSAFFCNVDLLSYNDVSSQPMSSHLKKYKESRTLEELIYTAAEF